VSGVPDGVSIHRGWARDAGQYLRDVRSEATFGACDWDDFLADVPQIPLGDALGDAAGDALRTMVWFSLSSISMALLAATMSVGNANSLHPRSERHPCSYICLARFPIFIIHRCQFNKIWYSTFICKNLNGRISGCYPLLASYIVVYGQILRPWILVTSIYFHLFGVVLHLHL
jgi:hypothetical protein